MTSAVSPEGHASEAVAHPTGPFTARLCLNLDEYQTLDADAARATARLHQIARRIDRLLQFGARAFALEHGRLEDLCSGSYRGTPLALRVCSSPPTRPTSPIYLSTELWAFEHCLWAADTCNVIANQTHQQIEQQTKLLLRHLSSMYHWYRLLRQILPYVAESCAQPSSQLSLTWRVPSHSELHLEITNAAHLLHSISLLNQQWQYRAHHGTIPLFRVQAGSEALTLSSPPQSKSEQRALSSSICEQLGEELQASLHC